MLATLLDQNIVDTFGSKRLNRYSRSKRKGAPFKAIIRGHRDVQPGVILKIEFGKSSGFIIRYIQEHKICRNSSDETEECADEKQLVKDKFKKLRSR